MLFQALFFFLKIVKDLDVLCFFACVIALARTFNTVLNRSDESTRPCLVLALREKFSVFHHSVSC